MRKKSIKLPTNFIETLWNLRKIYKNSDENSKESNTGLVSKKIGVKPLCAKVPFVSPSLWCDTRQICRCLLQFPLQELSWFQPMPYRIVLSMPAYRTTKWWKSINNTKFVIIPNLPCHLSIYHFKNQLRKQKVVSLIRKYFQKSNLKNLPIFINLDFVLV